MMRLHGFSLAAPHRPRFSAQADSEAIGTTVVEGTDQVTLSGGTPMTGQPVGMARGLVIDRKTQQPVDVAISTTPTRRNSFGTDFIAYLPLANGWFQELGHISVHDSVSDTNQCMRFDTIDARLGREHYHHIGQMLQQVAVEVALKRGYNHITGKSSPSYGMGDPISFHYKGGFVTYSNVLNQRLEKAQLAGHREALGETEIYLSPQGWQHWQRKIEANPILTEYDPLGELRISNPKKWLEAIYDITLHRGIRLPADVIQAAKALAGELKLGRFDPNDLEGPT